MRTWALVVLLLLAGCAHELPDDEVLVDDDAPFAERVTPEAAAAAVRLANRATLDELAADDRADLPRRAAENLIAYRLGPDATFGTADDRAFQTLAEVDAVPYVGRTSMARLLAYAHAEGFDAPPACAATDARPTRGSLFVTPDDGAAPVLSLIAAARQRIDLVMYQLRSSAVVDALAAAAARGARVRVILDRQQADSPRIVADLQARGVQAKLSPEAFTYTHQKTLVVDGRTALVFSGNFSGFTGRDYGVIERDWQDVDDLLALFEADWNRAAPDVACTRLVVAPVNARERILQVIEGATASLDVQALYVSDATVIDALRAAHDRGVDVRVLINDPAYGFSDGSVGRELAAAGIASRHSSHFFVHAKLLIADGTTVFLGSENFSWNSLENNREVGLVVTPTEVDVPRLRATYESDWNNAVSF